MKMLRPAFSASLCLLILSAVVPAQAASFDCKKAKTADEIAICNNTYLSELDTKMATLYGVRMKIPMMMGERGAVQDAQLAFLKKRGTCGKDKACIIKRYQSRIQELNKEIDNAMNNYCKLMGLCG